MPDVFDFEHFRAEPISFMDAHSGGAHLMLTVAVTFSGVIEEGRIRDAVQTLASAWPMLGCYIRTGQEGTFELLVPDTEHASLTTTFVHINKPLLATTSLPQKTQTISTQVIDRNTSLFYAIPPPSSAYAYIQENPRPGFQLHVSMLSDATVISLNFPHVLMDASGVCSFMRALVGVMHGEEVGKCIEGNPFSSIPDTTTKTSKEDLEGWTTYGPDEFIVSAQAEQVDLEKDGPISQRTIYFPRDEIDRLKAEAMKEVGETVPYLSSGDVIVAWLYKHFYGDEIYDPARTSRLLYILDARLRLPSLFPLTSTYLGNAYLVSPARPLTNARVRDMSIGQLASMVRLLVEESSKEENVNQAVRWKWDRSLEGGVQVPAKAGERVLITLVGLTFGLGDLNVKRAIRPLSGTGQLVDVYWGMPGIPSGVITFRDDSGGVMAQFDWAEKNWTNGTMGKYAIERLQTEDSKNEAEDSKTEIEEVAGKDYMYTTGGKESSVEERQLYAFVSWVRRWLRL
ncbi:Transferase domain-containing protein [Ceratobasidium sp. AG-Ba]|nr:Transferase domain-containing protein [Ceratobasidium sp. AG-Ba]